MNRIPAHLSLDACDNKIAVLFDHLPRPGDFIDHKDRMFVVDRVVFSLTDSNHGLVGVPNVFCKANKQVA